MKPYLSSTQDFKIFKTGNDRFENWRQKRHLFVCEMKQKVNFEFSVEIVSREKLIKKKIKMKETNKIQTNDYFSETYLL